MLGFGIGISAIHAQYPQWPDLQKPNNLSTHPYGILHLRLTSNIKTQPTKHFEIYSGIQSGNVWQPPVTAYLPLNADDIARLSGLPWEVKEQAFTPTATNSLRTQMQADGVIRLLQLGVKIRLHSAWELESVFRGFTLDGGKFPLSGLTDDAFIEWFHRNIAGGKDPFGRGQYGYHQAHVYFEDEQGRSLSFQNGTTALSGWDQSIHWYPTLKKLNAKGWFTNVSLQLGWNLSAWNQSVDMMLSNTWIKRMRLGKGRLTFSTSQALLWRSAINFNNPSTTAQYASEPRMFFNEVMVGWQHQGPSNRIWGYGLASNFQSSYNPIARQNDYVITGNRYGKSWQQGFTSRYNTLNSVTVFVNVQWQRWSVGMSLREDGMVDNAPDIQVGTQLHYTWQ